MYDIKKIKKLVEDSKKFPSPVIEYNFDLPEDDNITPDSFFGVKAVFNKSVAKSTGAVITFKY